MQNFTAERSAVLGKMMFEVVIIGNFPDSRIEIVTSSVAYRRQADVMLLS